MHTTQKWICIHGINDIINKKAVESINKSAKCLMINNNDCNQVMQDMAENSLGCIDVRIGLYS